MKTVCIYTLGCRVNQYESVAIAEALQTRGYTITKDDTACDYYILNTCSVTGESQRQSRQLARRFASRGKTAVLGCASQNQKEDFLSIDGVFYVGGCSDKMNVVEAVEQACEADHVADMRGALYEPMRVYGTSDLFSTCRAFIKIQDGCNGVCTYCIIPTLRGKSRTRPADEIVEEARRLVRAGYREIVLTGIETSAYGTKPLAELIVRLGALKEEGLARVRLGSLSLGTIGETFLNAIAASQNFMPHLHLSLQSGSTRVLGIMRRPYTRELALAKIALVREKLPHVQISADMITGFPTETEDEYLETERFVVESGLMHVHAFPYSEREGTPAATMEGAVPKEVRKERCARLNAVSAACRDGILSSFEGKTVRVLVERIKKGMANGHTEEFLECVFPAENASVGAIVSVAVSGHENGHLVGKELTR
ncbi:MAG: tRNA (N(6)-L-threonylcarbamoyladenosine(37)-C(2))-methylthiotransferase MtaB [Clostridia bacterium]|nr:tRNA (N(6)-L-threonylcarbamoyladenosine(37)-C(2))-methylthiotransferase MtaB [Clostridia bacterium]